MKAFSFFSDNIKRSGLWLFVYMLLCTSWFFLAGQLLFKLGLSETFCKGVVKTGGFVWLALLGMFLFNSWLDIRLHGRLFRLAMWNDFCHLRNLTWMAAGMEKDPTPNFDTKKLIDDIEEINSFMFRYKTELSPKAIRRLLKDTRPLYKEYKNNEKEFNQWAKSQKQQTV